MHGLYISDAAVPREQIQDPDIVHIAIVSQNDSVCLLNQRLRAFPRFTVKEKTVPPIRLTAEFSYTAQFGVNGAVFTEITKNIIAYTAVRGKYILHQRLIEKFLRKVAGAYKQYTVA